MSNPDFEVFVGVDMAKGEHYAQAITTQGVELFARPVSNDQAAIEAMLNQASAHGRVAIVVDMTSSGAQLLLGVMAQQGVPVAYVNGLVMRRAADLYAGAAKTDPRDAWVLADYARRNSDRLTWIEANDETTAPPAGIERSRRRPSRRRQPGHKPLPRCPISRLTCPGTNNREPVGSAGRLPRRPRLCLDQISPGDHLPAPVRPWPG